ncbi:MAG: M56 family metallopeptidase [Silvibacterium sp.]
MNPETQVAIMVAFTGFLLKTSLGLCICWAISKVFVSPRGRFFVWFAFLISATCYGLWLAVGLGFHEATVLPLQVPAGLTPSAPIGKLQIQASWAYPVSILLRSLGALYLAALGCFLFARIKKHAQLRWVLRFSYQAPDAIEQVFRPIAKSLEAGNVRLLVLSGIHSPATFGWIRPTVLLPPLCLDQDESELGDIFRHELQHVQRRDFVFNAVASFCRALLFFHPAAWYAMRRLELESELACDLAVVRESPERRATYAECLVRFARLNVAQQPRPWNLDFAGSSVQLKVRVRSMLAETKQIPGWLLGLRAALGLSLFAGFLGIAPSLFVVLSYDQQRIAQPAEPATLASTPQIPLRTSDVFKAASLRQALHANRSSAPLSPAVQTNVPVETAANATPIAPREARPVLSDQPGPTLKRRGDTSGFAGQKAAPATTILLSSEPSTPSADAAARRASAISNITTGASEALRIASRGHDRDGH